MENEARLQEIEKQEEVLHEILEEKEKNWNYDDGDFGLEGYEKYRKNREPEVSQLSKLDREKRMLMTPKFDELPDYGDVMSLEDFKGNVACGGFIDYDGYGHYVRDGKESNIEIYPSDVRHGSIRDDFDTIIWFNR